MDAKQREEENHPGGREGEGDRLHHARDRGQSTVSEPVEKGATELSVGDTSGFERQRVGQTGRRNEHPWTGKTASACWASPASRGLAAAATVTARDDLQRIKGVGPFIAEKANMLGITTFRQVANMTPELRTGQRRSSSSRRVRGTSGRPGCEDG